MTRILLFLLIACSATAAAQLNTTLRDNFRYDTGVNDVWGYVAPDGTEYAIVGLVDGVSFVSLADPDNLVEVARIAGDRSSWRDMKTFGTYAYSVADESTSSEGITAFDLSALPDTVTFTRNTYDIPGETVPFIRSHNLFIDEDRGVIFTSGGTQDLRDGGILMFDINDTPMAPVYVGAGPPIYSHDVTVLNDTMYASEIYRGELALYNVEDFNNITEIGRTGTPFSFTHNAWATDDGRYIFTTDEKNNAPVTSYDLSDKDDIKLLDEYRPAESLNRGAAPHNAHVIGDFVSISYYTDGLRVVDASCPDNLVEVANYDTFLGPDGGFNGAWGAYPFLPSGLTLVSDRQTGLYVIEVDYKSAAKIQGTLTDAVEGFPINGVQVVIDAAQPNLDLSGVTGQYKTGIADGGTYNAIFRHPDYQELSVEVEMVNGQIVALDTTMIPATTLFEIDVTLTDGMTGAPIAGGVINFEGGFDQFDVATNSAGGITGLELTNNQLYDVTFTAWGYQAQQITGVLASEVSNLSIELIPGYQDDFVSDLGWRVTSTAPFGNWDRVTPVGTTFEGQQIAPGEDAADDLGNKAYVTGSNSATAGSDDVDDGTVTLESPAFGPLAPDAEDLIVHFSYWFTNAGGNPPVNDALVISIDNGIDDFSGSSVPVEVRRYLANSDGWVKDSFRVADFVDETSNLKLIISTSDDARTGHLVEAGIDRFFVTESFIVGTEAFADESVAIDIYPNPSTGPFTVQYDAPDATDPRLRITDVNGKVISTRRLGHHSGLVQVGEDLPAGFYLLELLDGNQRLWSGKAVRK